MLCPKCGSKFIDGAKFCAKCGTKQPEIESLKDQVVTNKSTDEFQKTTGKEEKTMGIRNSVLLHESSFESADTGDSEVESKGSKEMLSSKQNDFLREEKQPIVDEGNQQNESSADEETNRISEERSKNDGGVNTENIKERRILSKRNKILIGLSAAIIAVIFIVIAVSRVNKSKNEEIILNSVAGDVYTLFSQEVFSYYDTFPGASGNFELVNWLSGFYFSETENEDVLLFTGFFSIRDLDDYVVCANDIKACTVYQTVVNVEVIVNSSRTTYNIDTSTIDLTYEDPALAKNSPSKDSEEDNLENIKIDYMDNDCVKLYSIILKDAFGGAVLSEESKEFLSRNLEWFPYEDYPSNEKDNYEEAWDAIEGWADCEWRWSGQYSRDLYNNIDSFYSHPLYIHSVVQSVNTKAVWTTTIGDREYTQTILFLETMDNDILYAFVYNDDEELFLESLWFGIDCIGVPIAVGQYTDEAGVSKDCVVFAASAIFG